MIWSGYKRSLEKTDLWNLEETELCENLTQLLEGKFNEALAKYFKYEFETILMHQILIIFFFNFKIQCKPKRGS